MSKVTLSDLELQAIQDNIYQTRNTYTPPAWSPWSTAPTALFVENLEPVIEKIIERRLTAQRQWVGGRDA